MARIIVGADESAGDVAAALLELADRQQDVQTRTDGPSLAFEVPDKVYEKYVGGKADKRPDDEQRANSVQRTIAQRGADDPDKLVSDDELPDAAQVAEPGDGADELVGDPESEQLPESAQVVDPPANGDAPDNGEGADQADPEPEPETKPRKRTSTPRKRAAKSTPAAAGNDK